MNLKPTKFVTNSTLKQYLHITSELIEVGLALLGGDTQKIGLELVDLQISCQTMIAKHGFVGDKYSDLKRKVIEKNTARFYYE